MKVTVEPVRFDVELGTLAMRILWLTLSKALDRSHNVSSDIFLLSILL